MENKQIWMIFVASFLVALFAFLLVISLWGMPQFGPIGDITPSNKTNIPIYLPDLIVEDIAVLVGSSNNYSIYDVNAIAFVKNIGNARADFSYTTVYIEGSSGCPLYQYTPPLNPGQEAQVNCSGQMSPGEYSVVAMADFTNRIRESNENNNDYNITFHVP